MSYIRLHSLVRYMIVYGGHNNLPDWVMHGGMVVYGHQ